MNNKRIICNGCKIETDSFFMTEYKDGRSYCSACNIKLHVDQHNKRKYSKRIRVWSDVKSCYKYSATEVKRFKREGEKRTKFWR